MVILTGDDLTLDKVRQVIFEKEQVDVSPASWERVEESRNTVDSIVQNGEIVYGINTGFGKLSDVKIKDQDVKELQKNLILSHASGVGEPFPETIAKTICLLRANALLKGYSGVRPVIIERLLQFINLGIVPVIPQQGSLGASGDLAPLSHLALTIIGEGEVFYKGERVPTCKAYQREELEPIQLEAKEGLALINGTQAMTAIGAIAYLEAEKLAYQSEIIASLTIEALQGIIDAFYESIHRVRGYVEQMEVAKRIRQYLSDSHLTTRQGEKRVQDAYSIRCIPQVHGASWQTLNYVKEKLEIEMNAATDNPLIFTEEDKVISGGNFHGQPIAFAMDFLKIGMSELANISERRTERLVNPQLNDFPPFLSPDPGLQSGLMILQYSAASLVSENKTLAHPASVDSIPSSANQEDHVSMGTTAARHAYEIIQNVRTCLAIECICALQALEYRGVDKMASMTKQFYEEARKIVPKISRDRIFSKDIERMNGWLKKIPLFFLKGD
ncbi:histidine ammonia-lyase [Fervidibacillus halotolerans]|uniref:Histidine ammonia-lyase n=1 Tax=Fervidibacillus halotolerans TaxID=2980027 RepID=A0A9E8LY03_9BACI|nr:histidine ammonia-lyase [Fervidibacillus halotolerans]WAA11833.1 histidine ammonia-lyase [Fervidibacillus halotolerans]